MDDTGSLAQAAVAPDFTRASTLLRPFRKIGWHERGLSRQSWGLHQPDAFGVQLVATPADEVDGPAVSYTITDFDEPFPAYQPMTWNLGGTQPGKVFLALLFAVEGEKDLLQMYRSYSDAVVPHSSLHFIIRGAESLALDQSAGMNAAHSLRSTFLKIHDPANLFYRW